MTWRNDAQKCAAIRVLLKPSGMHYCWDETGPTPIGLDLLERRGGGVSHGQALMLFAAFDIWNGCGKAEFGELVSVLDAINLGLLSGLLAAFVCTPHELDVWIQSDGQISPPIGSLILAERIANDQGTSLLFPPPGEEHTTDRMLTTLESIQPTLLDELVPVVCRNCQAAFSVPGSERKTATLCAACHFASSGST